MRKPIIISAIAVLAVMVLIVALIPQLLHRPDDTADTTPGTLTVADRPDCPPTALGVELPCLGGATTPASGKKQIVNVWAWWCVPCREELPLLQEYHNTHPEVDIILVHADPDAARGAALLNELGITLPSFQDATNLFAGTKQLPGVIPITLTDTETFIRPFTTIDALEEALA
ncbi:MAG: TlpA disulfide reductase family protein [Corynebacterium sp.]|nr:TlpA disulfide reductase family protein [Corynebacterium sp.]